MGVGLLPTTLPRLVVLAGEKKTPPALCLALFEREHARLQHMTPGERGLIELGLRNELSRLVTVILGRRRGAADGPIGEITAAGRAAGAAAERTL